MIKVVSVARMREIEAAAAAAGISYDMMMQNAGRAAAERALEIIRGIEDARVTVLIGPGNNGGDGLVAAHFIAQSGSAQVRCYLLKRRSEEDDTNFKAVREAGLFVAFAEDDPQYRVLRNMVASADLVIDALFGIGVKLPIKDDAQKVLRNVNQALNERRSEKPELQFQNPAMPQIIKRAFPYMLATDCPSGLDCDSGVLDKNAVMADETITFIAAKSGLLKSPGISAVGELWVAPSGIPEDLPELQRETTTLVDAWAVRELLPARPVDSHKGTFGKAFVVAGSVNYTGAAGLAAMSAYRVGVGLVTVGAPQPVIATLAAQLLEPTWILLPHDMGVLSEKAADVLRDELSGYDALLLGPGWGRENTTRTLLTELFNQQVEGRRSKRPIGFLSSKSGKPEESEQAHNEFPPLVVDADALNLLSEIDEWWKYLPANTIITPHPGEMARLAKVETAEIQANRTEIAQQKAAAWQVIVMLKGAHTVIAAPDGRTALLPFKSDALAKAGTGDVLAGTIVGLLAQGLAPFDAAVVGGYLHGLAGTLAASRSSRSVVAHDVVEALPAAFKALGK